MQVVFIFSELNYVPYQLFSYFPFLWRLFVSGTGLTHLDSDSFDYSKTLAEFIADDNSLTVIEAHTFKKLTNIEFISLKNNKIYDIQTHAFYGVKYLFAIDLSHNHLHYISNETFIGLEKLSFIYLNDNYMYILDANLFTPCVALQNLNLRHNLIEAISDTAFTSNKDLTLIFLAENVCVNKDFPTRAAITRNNYEDLQECFRAYDDAEANKHPGFFQSFLFVVLLAAAISMSIVGTGSVAYIRYYHPTRPHLQPNYNDSFSSDTRSNQNEPFFETIDEEEVQPIVYEREQQPLNKDIQKSYESCIKGGDKNRNNLNFKVLGQPSSYQRI